MPSDDRLQTGYNRALLSGTQLGGCRGLTKEIIKDALTRQEVIIMVDWGAASTVALSGLISVFVVLIILQVSVQATSWVVSSLDKKKQEKLKATN